MTLYRRTALHQITALSWATVPVLLRYDPADPFVLTFVFDDGAVWLTSREQFREGLEHPVGAGEVRVWPSRLSPDVLFLHLQSPAGEVLFELSRSMMADFLDQADKLVPMNEQTALPGLDDWLHAVRTDPDGGGTLC